MLVTSGGKNLAKDRKNVANKYPREIKDPPALTKRTREQISKEASCAKLKDEGSQMTVGLQMLSMFRSVVTS